MHWRLNVCDPLSARLSILVIVMLACDVSVNIAPTNTVPTMAETPVLIKPPTTTPEIFISLTQAIPATAVVQPSPVTNTLVMFGRLSLEIPSSVTSGVSGSDIAPVTNEDAAYWMKTPGHLQVSLGDYYILQGKITPAADLCIPRDGLCRTGSRCVRKYASFAQCNESCRADHCRSTSCSSILQFCTGLCIQHSGDLFPKWERHSLPDGIWTVSCASQQP